MSSHIACKCGCEVIGGGPCQNLDDCPLPEIYWRFAESMKQVPRAVVEPRHLDGLAAYRAAEITSLCKRVGEKDTAFVKRIVCAYENARLQIHGVGRRPSCSLHTVARPDCYECRRAAL